MQINVQQQLDQLSQQFSVLSVVDLSQWTDLIAGRNWLEQTCKSLHKPQFETNERIVFVHTQDYYSDSTPGGIMLRNLQSILNHVDISNFFVIVVSTNPEIYTELSAMQEISTDPVPVTVVTVTGEFEKRQQSNYSKKTETYRYGSVEPLKISVNELSDRERFLLTESETFCMYPWIHLHAYPTGKAYPCCHAEMKPGVVGDCRTQTLQEIWTGEPMQRLRDDMLNERKNPACERCYEQEAAGFFSGRKSANKHHGHQIKKLEKNPFELTYWDIRFSNLCNLRCRSCGHIFSSQWYQDQAKLAGPDWKQRNTVLNYAGRTETDMWEQLEPHLEYVEQIYFAGGEPLLMEEHYRILDELDRRGMYHVRLIYNTNFTHTDLKGRSVFEYWKKFQSVAVGASLDDMGSRAEYIRKGTAWGQVERNREDMLRICPGVDFYISPTLSIMNARHLPKFHRVWVEKGLLRPQDLNVNILQDPAHYRIDIAPKHYKAELTDLYQQHIAWLKQQGDPLGRATHGFESAIQFMNATDNSHLIPTFWEKTNQLDDIRNERCLDVIPELSVLQ